LEEALDKRKVQLNYYSKEAERGILYKDPDLKIDWILPEGILLISDKDKANKTLKGTNYFNQ
jgi:dTDP-4-dehydrorhamnose 3,5-epimerase